MACVLTCAVADIRRNKLYYAHVGDTRLYLLRDHSLVKLSKDHSVVGFLEESGRLSEEDAMRHPRRNEITRALGFEEVVNAEDFIETGESPFLPGDTILVCSDGLSDMISSNIITSILMKQATVAEKARELVAAANDAGGNDNITAVLVQNYNPQAPRVVLKPAEKKLTKQKELVEGDVSHEEEPVIPARRSRSLIVLLILLSLGLLSVLAFKKNAAVKEISTATKAVATKPTDINFELINTAVLTDSTKVHSINPSVLLNLSAPIIISKDSFYIRGNGAVFSADSAYKGPAFIINSSSKKIVLDSITFKDLDVALIVRKNNVTFKNVRFINCRVPVQYELPLPDSMLSGHLKDSIFIQIPTFKKR
jgi:PPM family protein phosphatase